MGTTLLASLLATLIATGDGGVPCGMPPASDDPVLRLAEPGGVIFDAGNSRRPRAEVPTMAVPESASAGPSDHDGPRSGERGDEAEGSRDLGEHRPGELYLVPGEHRPGDLDRQGTFRPGDLG